MTMRLAGAALAAVMACGCTSKAEAALITFYQDRYADGYGGNLQTSVSGYIDTLRNYASYNYQTYFGCDGFIPDCISGVLESSSYSTNKLHYGSNSIPDYGVEFYGNIGPANFDFLFAPDSVLSAYISGPGQFFTFYDLNVKYNTSVLPLPATAPLFGVGLLALGCLGYARRRASAIQAA